MHAVFNKRSFDHRFSCNESHCKYQGCLPIQILISQKNHPYSEIIYSSIDQNTYNIQRSWMPGTRLRILVWKCLRVLVLPQKIWQWIYHYIFTFSLPATYKNLSQGTRKAAVEALTMDLPDLHRIPALSKSIEEIPNSRWHTPLAIKWCWT